MSISEEFEAEGKVKYSQPPPDIFLYARDLHWFVCRSDAPLEPWWTQYTTRQCSATLWLGGAFAECLSSALSTHKRHGHAATATGTLPAHRHWGIFHHHNLRYVKWLNTILTHSSWMFPGGWGSVAGCWWNYNGCAGVHLMHNKPQQTTHTVSIYTLQTIKETPFYSGSTQK